MTTSTTNTGKTVVIISYFTIIGWVIALIMHNKDKTELGAFHLRQMVGLLLVSVVVSLLSRVGGIGLAIWIFQIGVFILWIIGLIGAFNVEKKEVPLLGAYFQEWFKAIN